MEDEIYTMLNRSDFVSYYYLLIHRSSVYWHRILPLIEATSYIILKLQLQSN